ncbi:DegT/DnrJ/EryC1/StrS family aminotransferase, partial [Micrococcus sp. SIMBA_131]
NIELRPLWKPLHLQPLFQKNRFYAYSEERCVSEELYQIGICLPSGTGMTEFEQKRVIESLEKVLLEKARTTILRA